MNYAGICALALGSNWQARGTDNLAYLQEAEQEIASKGLKIIEKSAYFVTPAFPDPSDHEFLNSTVLCKVDGTAPECLEKLHQIEAQMGRTRQKRWGRRVIDLDILFFEDAILPDLHTQKSWMDLPLSQQVHETPDSLLIPHPRLQDRSFVLVPLAQIAPDWTHPVLGQTVTEMLAKRPPEEQAQVIPL